STCDSSSGLKSRLPRKPRSSSQDENFTNGDVPEEFKGCTSSAKPPSRDAKRLNRYSCNCSIRLSHLNDSLGEHSFICQLFERTMSLFGPSFARRQTMRNKYQ